MSGVLLKCACGKTLTEDRIAFDCEDCIGMREHGCYCASVGAIAPGGPLKETPIEHTIEVPVRQDADGEGPLPSAGRQALR